MATAEVQEFFERLRSGDEREVAALLHWLDPSLRKMIRLRLVDGRLRRAADTSDIFQSLVKDFLSQKEGNGSAGDVADQLSAYLAAAVRNKIQTRARKERRNAGSLPENLALARDAASAVKQVDEMDEISAIRRRLPEDARRLFDMSREGLTWVEISQQVGGSPDTLRMRLRRAIARALAERDGENSGHA